MKYHGVFDGRRGQRLAFLGKARQSATQRLTGKPSVMVGDGASLSKAKVLICEALVRGTELLTEPLLFRSLLLEAFDMRLELETLLKVDGLPSAFTVSRTSVELSQLTKSVAYYFEMKEIKKHNEALDNPASSS